MRDIGKRLANAALVLAAGTSFFALPVNAILFSGTGTNPETSGHSVSGQANFTLSGSILTLILTNTSGDTSDQGDALTGLIFTIGGSQTLSTSCPSLPSGSAIWTSTSASNTIDPLCGSWTDQLAASPPLAAEFGVATTGFNGEFNGGSISLGNASPNYGIVGGLTFPGTIGGSQFPFIQNALKFDFTVASGSVALGDISGVQFLFGTDGTGKIPGNRVSQQQDPPTVPEPDSLALVALALLVLAATGKGRKRTL